MDNLATLPSSMSSPNMNKDKIHFSVNKVATNLQLKQYVYISKIDYIFNFINLLLPC